MEELVDFKNAIILSNGLNPETIIDGYVINETEKAIQICFGIVTIWNKQITVYSQTSWIPKSQLVVRYDDVISIKPNFLKIMKSYKCQKHYIKDGEKIDINN